MAPEHVLSTPAPHRLSNTHVKVSHIAGWLAKLASHPSSDSATRAYGCRMEGTIVKTDYPTSHVPLPTRSSFLCLVFLLWWISISFQRTCEIYSKILFFILFKICMKRVILFFTPDFLKAWTNGE